MSAVLVVAAYLLGSVPFAYLLAQRVAGVDLRAAGSGNVGATNLLRTTRWSAALIALLLDGLKGAVAAWMGRVTAGDTLAAGCALGAIVGHIYPVWLGFRGGKGVATACGAFAVLTPVATLVAAGTFLTTAWLTRFASLGSIVAAVVLPYVAWWTGARAATTGSATIAALLILFRHRANVRRLLAGTERQVGRKKVEHVEPERS